MERRQGGDDEHPTGGRVEWKVLTETAPHAGVRSRRLDSDALTVIRYELEARATYPSHTHEHEHYLLGLAGHATAALGDETVQLASADLIFVPAGVMHGATAGVAGATFLNIGPRRP